MFVESANITKVNKEDTLGESLSTEYRSHFRACHFEPRFRIKAFCQVVNSKGTLNRLIESFIKRFLLSRYFLTFSEMSCNILAANIA